MFNKTNISNIFSLLILQGSNYILPLITLPFLIRTLGNDHFGSIVFVTAIMQYIVVFCDFGFNYTSTRKIALVKDNNSQILKIIYSTYATKLILMAGSLIVLMLLLFIFQVNIETLLLYIVSFFFVVGNVLFPTWYFQGMEKMKNITIINIVSRLISVVFIFIFINDPEDYIKAAFFQSLGPLIAGIIGFYLIFKTHNFSFNEKPTFSEMINEIKEGWKVFISSVSTTVYVQGSVIVVGIVGSPALVGQYSIIHKIVQAIQGISQPIAQALYPHFCNQYEKNLDIFKQLKTKFIYFSIAFSFTVSIATFFSAEEILLLIAGDQSSPSLVYLFELWTIVLFFVINNILLNSLILAMNKFGLMLKVYVYSAIVFVLISLPLTMYFDLRGMFVSILTIELMIFIRGLSILKQKMQNDLMVA
nr:oligosaccharide flippase family protein [Terribacillus saccharophilus]